MCLSRVHEAHEWNAWLSTCSPPKTLPPGRTIMLLELSRWLAEHYWRAFSGVEYITFRAVLACATALVIGVVAGPWVIRKLTVWKIGRAVRSYVRQAQLEKTGTPTMRGALVLIVIGLSTASWPDC